MVQATTVILVDVFAVKWTEGAIDPTAQIASADGFWALPLPPSAPRSKHNQERDTSTPELSAVLDCYVLHVWEWIRT